jgi:Fe-S cluster assembly protein SufD
MENAEKQYIELFTTHEATVRQHAATCMNRPRTQAFADFERQGFPSLKTEDYRYTDVKQAFAPTYGLNLKRFQSTVNPSDVFRCEVPNLSTQLFYIVNDSFCEQTTPPPSRLPAGVYAGSMKHFSEQHPAIAARYYGQIATTAAEDAITPLNTMFAQDGFVLYVPRKVKINQTIQLIQIIRSQTDIMANRRLLIILEPYSEARLLVCDHNVDTIKSLSTQVIEIYAHEGAYFDYYDLEESATSNTRFSSLYLSQSARSNVLINGITLSNGLTRNNYRITLQGEEAETTLCGMAIQDQRQQVDTCTHITHAAPRCKSTELFKNLLDDRSTGIFSGRILVKEGAIRTEAHQTNRNMCLTRESRIYGKPQLEINADDVKCSHGMTTGQLDEQALFYMQSRGIARDEARTLLSVAFTSDVIENVRLEPLKDRLHYLVEKRFRGESARCEQCNICK